MKKSKQYNLYVVAQNKLARELKSRGKLFVQCPKCKTVIKGASKILLCAFCGHHDENYHLNGKTIIKNVESKN